eukprot:scaffold4635_cov267-Pinguiococcus_pyrenoidosus.AAC.38
MTIGISTSGSFRCLCSASLLFRMVYGHTSVVLHTIHAAAPRLIAARAFSMKVVPPLLTTKNVPSTSSSISPARVSSPAAALAGFGPKAAGSASKSCSASAPQLTRSRTLETALECSPNTCRLSLASCAPEAPRDSVLCSASARSPAPSSSTIRVKCSDMPGTLTKRSSKNARSVAEAFGGPGRRSAASSAASRPVDCATGAPSASDATSALPQIEQLPGALAASQHRSHRYDIVRPRGFWRIFPPFSIFHLSIDERWNQDQAW